MSGQRYKFAKKSKSLQELFSTKGTIIQIGKNGSIKVRDNWSIPVLPSFLIVNEDGEVWDDQDNFQFKLGTDGTLAFQSENLINHELMDFLKKEKIQKIQIQNNLVWIWQKGKPIKRYYFSMDKRVIIDADTHDAVEFISEIRLLVES